MDSNIFLICSERSGSNLITKIINTHPDYSGPSPAHLFRAFLKKEDSRYYGSKPNLLNDVKELWNLKMSDWLYKWNDKDFDEAINAAQIINTIYSKEAQLRGKKHSFIKEVKTYKLFEDLLQNFPNSKFVLSVRDPRDMALSWSKDPVLRGGVIRASNTWLEDQTAALSLILRYSDRIAFIRYEDLLANTEITLKGMCDKLGINFSRHMLQHTSKNDENEQLDTVSWQNLAKPLMTNNYQKFITELREDQIEYIEQKCSGLMEVFGYKSVIDKANWQNMGDLEEDLRKEERYEKEEYMQVVPIEERSKREKWMQCFRKIKDRT